ncbi:DUF6090 family protein [Robiginitalea sp. IMCC43444]|uniref:DUF6090 family protein n=1 Tax=Robiginitalea sp. IMCC43444 TaxID=3459121 RepID=UPI004041E5F3
MIKFFGKIRQNLLSAGKTGKYLKYALGEVILVVIGILIALSINNWNENKKDRATEKRILKQLVKNLETIESGFKQTLQYNDKLSKSSVIVLDVLKNRLPYYDSLSYHFDRAKNRGTALLTIPKPGYESLKNTGFDIIVNEELKNAIIELFEVDYPILETSTTDAGFDVIIENYLMANFYRNGINLIPFDYNQILEDKYFFSIINRRYEFRFYHKFLIERAMFQTDSVKQLIVENITSK